MHLAFLLIREILRQDLQRDLAAEFLIGRSPHLSHAAFAKYGGDLETTETLTDVHFHAIRNRD